MDNALAHNNSWTHKLDSCIETSQRGKCLCDWHIGNLLEHSNSELIIPVIS